MINKKSISEKAGYYFENGYHCAEAIVAAVLEVTDTVHTVPLPQDVICVAPSYMRI